MSISAADLWDSDSIRKLVICILPSNITCYRGRWGAPQIVFSSEKSGRLLKYNPHTQETTVLMKNLQFPNGVSLSKDTSFLVFSEACPGRLLKYWLKGEKAGTWEVFAILPGFPDSIRTNENGEFWVALHCRRSMYSHILGLYPKLRKFILKPPVTIKVHYLLQVGGNFHAQIVKHSHQGKLLRVLEDGKGKVVKAVSEVEERDKKLWIGSVLMPFIAVYDLD
ncbi:Protein STRICTOSIDINE SYNTHASE-LIKE 3 [Hibiscus syriacus]|uniref:Protein STRICTOSIDINE SYNTHASE-LIKE 3 n=1 Tax=Hibiscus syriacus TaxID=106335 RepID=A0A6A3B3R8_HIBSY|nr:Protein STRICTOSIDINE SYNTHASE-LIKE 3 [Hibiscus syriacus]